MVDFEQLVKQIEAETLEMAPAPIAPRQAPTLHADRRTDTIKVPDVASAYVLRCGPAPSTTDPRRYAARMAASILGDDGGSRFFWELIDTGKAETAVAWVQEYDDCGLLNTFLACDPHDVKACLKTMDRVAKKVMRTLTEAELREAQSRANSAAILGSERPSNRMFSLGEDWMSLGRYESLDEVLESYRRVSLAEVKSVIEQFGFEPHAEVQVMPQ
jgi:predicted Zn-dependent peptidase